MNLRDLRAPTTDTEHAQAIADAEYRLGRKLTTAEQRIDIVGQDRDLKNGKARLEQAIKDEQARTARAWVETGMPIQLNVTQPMLDAINDLYDAGVDHATRELEAAGITVTRRGV